MSRALWVVVAAAAGFLAFALASVTQLLAVNVPCVSATLPVFGGVAGHGNPCTRFPSWFPLPGWFLGALGAAALLVLLVCGAVTAARMLWRTWRLVKACEASACRTSPGVARAAQCCGLENVREVDQSVTAFCCGLFRPVIVVGSVLARTLDDDELEAVLHHEAAHARRHDPAGLLLGRSLSRLLFFLPCIADLIRHHEAVIEIEADRRALSYTKRKALVGALLKTASCPAVEGKDIAVGTFDPTADRLEHLATGTRPRPGTTRRHLAATVAAVTLVSAGWWWAQPVAQISDEVKVVEVPAYPVESR